MTFTPDQTAIASRHEFVTWSMANDTDRQREAQHLLQNTTLYREFLAEREEILRHKWLESEKAGRDVGFDSALMDWITHHRSGWRRTRQQRGEMEQLN